MADRRCSAKRKNGQPCTRRPIRGGMVCPMHGGSAPQVKAKARERLADLIDPDRVLRTAAAFAYSDITQLYNDDGSVKAVKEWPPELRVAVKKMRMLRANPDGTDGETTPVMDFELVDKTRALEMLFKHLGLLTEKLEHSGSIEIKWQE